MNRRRKTGRRYQANLQLSRRGEHGLTLDTGIYISRIIPGSVAARESMIAVGDRVEAINESNLDNIKSAQVTFATFIQISVRFYSSKRANNTKTVVYLLSILFFM